jgi:ADP-heptose:LPS heptosyltransferase
MRYFREAADYKNLGSICFVFLHGIGDFVMFTPSLKKIKEINPSIKITVVLRKELGLRELAEHLGSVDEVLEISLKTPPRIYIPWVFWTYEYWAIRRKLKDALRGRVFDRKKIFLTQVLPTFVYLLFRPGRVRMHRVERFSSMLGLSLAPGERNRTHLNIPERAARRAREALSPHCDPASATVVGIQRNTFDRTRYISLKAVQGFIDRLNGAGENLFFVIFADKNSYALEEKADGGHLAASNLVYSLDLMGGGGALGLAALVDACRYIVSVDSAVFNIACALGKDTVGVFNTYKVRSSQRALARENIVCIDGFDPDADGLLEKFNCLYAGRKVRNV